MRGEKYIKTLINRIVYYFLN